MMLLQLLKLKSPAFDPLVTALLTVSRSARTSFNFVSSGGPSDETKNRDQLVGLQEGALVNERPDLPDDLLRRILGRATTSCACMRKSRSPLSVWPHPLPTISSMMLRWLLKSKSSLFSPLATALLIASSSAPLCRASSRVRQSRCEERRCRTSRERSPQRETRPAR